MTQAELTRGTMEGLAADLQGSILYPEDDGFAEAIALWNGMITKRPAVVVRPADKEDVVRTVNYAATTASSCRSRAAVTTSRASP